MPLSVLDIHKQQFSRSFWGYNVHEVEAFLRLVAQSFEELQAEKNALKQALKEKDLEIQYFRQKEQTLESILQNAQHMSEKIRQDAQREAQLILQDAQAKADLLVQDAKNRLKSLYEEISDIERRRLQFETQLKALLQTHLSLLQDRSKSLSNLIRRDSPEISNAGN